MVSTAANAGPPSAAAGHAKASAWALTIGAIGVVYGDIGTSPLYSIKECFSPESHHHVAVTSANVFGVLSLVLWSLVAQRASGHRLLRPATGACRRARHADRSVAPTARTCCHLLP